MEERERGEQEGQEIGGGIKQNLDICKVKWMHPLLEEEDGRFQIFQPEELYCGKSGCTSRPLFAVLVS